MLKKISLTIVTITLLASVCATSTLNIFAAETPATTTEKVYYSDLFYGYDTSYLSESTMLKLHANQTSNILADIYNDFADSDAGFWSMFKTGLNMSTSALFKLDFIEYVKLMSDTYGNTDYIYKNSLDSANKVFAESLLQSSKGAISNDAEDYFGAAKKVAKRASSLLKVYDTFEKNYDIEKLTDYEIVYTMFEYIKGEGIFLAVGSANITKVEEVVLKDVAKYVKMASKTADALETVQTICVGIMLEDVRMEIVNEILASSPTDSCIYDGMSRLKNQLSGGFITYFAENYLKEAVLDSLVESVTKPLLKTIREGHVTYAIVGDALSVASWVIFDAIFDVPDLGDMTTQKVLASYADDLYQLLKAKIEVFSSQFDSSDILKFEAVFDGYIAATNAALKKSQSMALDSNRPELDGITYVWKDFCYSQYIKYVVEGIKAIPVSERKVNYFEIWTNPSGTFRSASDTIEADSIYLFNGALNANVEYTKSITVNSEENISPIIKGNVTIGASKAITVTIPLDADITIGGKLTVKSFASDGNSKYFAYLKNEGDLTCLEDVEFVSYKPDIGSATYGYYVPAQNSRLILKKNLISIYYSSDPQGTIEFAGIEQQEAYLPKASIIEISNTSNEGVVFTSNISVYKLFNHKSNNFTLYNNGSGSNFVDYDGDGLLDNVDPYPTVSENSEVTEPIPGDFDSDEKLDMKDVIYFMNWINFSWTGKYPMVYEGDKDFNKDGNVDMKDVVYFMNYVNFSWTGNYNINW